MNDKKFQYSKMLVFVTGIIFVLSLAYCLTKDISNVSDLTIYTVAITVTGGVFSSAIIWYEKKSQAENVSKIQMQQIKDVAKVEFEVYEKKVRLQKEMGIIESDDCDDFHIDNQVDATIDTAESFLKDKMCDAVSEPEIKSY